MMQRVALISLALMTISGSDIAVAAKPSRGEDALGEGLFARATVVDPTLSMLSTIIELYGPSSSLFARRAVHPTSACVLAKRRREAPARASSLAFIQEHPTTALPASYAILSVPWERIEEVASSDVFERMESCWEPIILPPSEVIADLTGVAAQRRMPSLGWTGEGVVVTDIDSGIDVLHPAFFRADGGFYPWVDVNADGVFSPGVDGVDFDRDGKVESNETLRILEAVSIRDGDRVEPVASSFRTRQDWLFLDRNRDRVRNAGPEQGFFEDDPGYGEPLWVADDVDGDGVLGVGEQLVLLSTSKIVRYLTDEEEYVRGENLIEAVRSRGHQRAFHGTGVAGALLGGQAGYHDRVGVAPDAEIVMVGLTDEVELTSPLDNNHIDHAMAIEAAARSGSDLILHEWSNPFTQPIDGSTLVEEVMTSTASGSDVLHIKPVGNLHGSNKHTEAALSVGESIELEAIVPDEEGFSATVGSLQWRGVMQGGGDALDVSLTSPEGERVDLVLGGQRVQELHKLGEDILTVTLEKTSAGTHLLRFYIFSGRDDLPIAAGGWRFELSGASGDVELIGRISDYQTSWSGGVGWSAPRGDRYTVSFPSSVETGVAVGSFVGRYPFDDDLPGGLRAYSGRGPTFDGRFLSGVVAPDDAFVPLALTDRIIELGGEPGYYIAFGGTSGAAAQVAGAAALLLEQERGRSSQELASVLTENALQDGIPGVSSWPDAGWLNGKLDAYAMFAGGERFDDDLPEAPMVMLVASRAGDAILFEAMATGEGLEYRFDLEYDGRFDTEWSGESEASVVVSEAISGDGNPRWAKVLVRDRAGQMMGALARYPDEDGVDEEDMGGVDMGNGGPGRSRCLCRVQGATAPVEGRLALFIAALLLGLRRRDRRERIGSAR